MKTRVPLIFLAASLSAMAAEYRSIPREPLEIGITPQFFVDTYIVDNRWAVNYDRGSREQVLREFHPPAKYPGNPLLSWPRRQPPTLPQPAPAWINVVRDEVTGDFKMWYAHNEPVPDPRPGRGIYTTAIAYAESKDGLNWTLPNLGLHELNGSRQNNIVWMGPNDRRAGELQIITQIPDEARRGYRHLMIYLGGGGIRMVGSHDGIHWDKASDQVIHPMASDFPNNIVYDPVKKEYVMYCRAKTLYLVGGNRDADGNIRDILDVGESRRVARMSSPELWTQWSDQPQQILESDELDNIDGFTAIYAFTVQRYAGIYWGFVHPFRWNNWMHAELAFSRDTLRFDRLLTRPKLIPRGPEGSWDSGMILAAYNWVEVGDEWWLYYNGWDGPHGVQEMRELGRFRSGAIGMVTLRKERFISMRGPENGGVICTRRIVWPGGGLFVNADARAGELKVRVSDEFRKVYPGFDYKDCVGFNGDETAHEIKWRGANLDSLKGKVVRLEIFLKRADLFTFRAGGSGGQRGG